MAYFSPYIDDTGLHAPSYYDILQDHIDAFRRIYGNDVYLESDGQDYQELSIQARAAADLMDALKAVYYAIVPGTASGVGLDSMSLLTGIHRLPATRGEVVLEIKGIPGMIFSANQIVAQDTNAIAWTATEAVTLDDDGIARVIATCNTPGKILGKAGEISIIARPTSGWYSVNNPSDAIPGNDKETDEELRARRALSVSAPSRSITDALHSLLLGVEGVHRVRVLENDTKATDENGLPGNSVCAVVEGGDEEDIARTIYIEKTPGCLSHGNTQVDVETDRGDVITISFDRPAYVDISVRVRIKPLISYSGAFDDDKIKQSIVGYVDTLSIGDGIILSMLYAVATQSQIILARPSFSINQIEIAIKETSFSSSDIVLLYNQIAQVSINDIEIIVE